MDPFQPGDHVFAHAEGPGEALVGQPAERAHHVPQPLHRQQAAATADAHPGGAVGAQPVNEGGPGEPPQLRQDQCLRREHVVELAVGGRYVAAVLALAECVQRSSGSGGSTTFSTASQPTRSAMPLEPCWSRSGESFRSPKTTDGCRPGSDPTARSRSLGRQRLALPRGPGLRFPGGARSCASST